MPKGTDELEPAEPRAHPKHPPRPPGALKVTYTIIDEAIAEEPEAEHPAKGPLAIEPPDPVAHPSKPRRL